MGAYLPGTDNGIPAYADVVAADLCVRDRQRVGVQAPYLHLRSDPHEHTDKQPLQAEPI